MTTIHTDYPPELTVLSDDGLVQHINTQIEYLHTNHNLPTMHVQNRNRIRHDITTAINYFRHRLEYERQHAIEVQGMMQDERNQIRDDLRDAQGLLRFERDDKARLRAEYHQQLAETQRRYEIQINNYRNRDRNLRRAIDRLVVERNNARAQTNNARNQYNFVYNQLGESNHQNGILQLTTRNLTRLRDRLQAQVGVLRIQVAWFRARAGPPAPPPPVIPPQIIWIQRS